MTTFELIRRMYSLDTLDTRFTTTTRTPLKRGSEARVDPAQDKTNKAGAEARQGTTEPSPSRWKTPEFFLYYVVIIVVLPLMFNAAFEVSRASHPNYSTYESLLETGWILGRKVDNSDAQYAGFRENLLFMFFLLGTHPLLRKVFERFRPSNGGSSGRYAAISAKPNESVSGPVSAADAEPRLGNRVVFDIGFAIVLLTGLHGVSVLKIFLILYVNYSIATRMPQSYIPAATWVFNIGILFANELSGGYKFAAIADAVYPWSVTTVDGKGLKTAKNWGAMIDDYGGLVPRWEIMFNITVLKMISFNLDYYWSLSRSGGSPIEKKQLDVANLSERDRISTPASPHDYSFRNYVAYALYSPLYIAGPILTFNDYMSQLRYPASSLDSRRTALYGIRFLLTLLCMEFMLHFIYAVAISKAHPAWEIYTPFQLSMLGYFNLHIIWLKLLLPWRFFRLWALIDGIDPPENMVRCMSDNYSAIAFWRGWHRSFNKWTVRYIYIPLGGSGAPGSHGLWGKVRVVGNFLAVFTFVALWHDINLKLLMWGWLITLFVLPEIIATVLFPRKKWENNKEAYRVICGIGAIGNVLMMMAANLVGFAVGLDGLQGLVHGIVGSYSGVVFLVAACACLFVGVQIMFEVREQEMRQGIHLRC
ncbi:MAG: glycerol transporter [Vezdaea acicularis]|nr:MAG: glycerol transporter [Vezdaea acicularis]